MKRRPKPRLGRPRLRSYSWGYQTLGKCRSYPVYEVAGGARIEDSITMALRTTGVAVLSTFAVMVGGILPWTFSPLLFHNEMSVLLIFLMGANMIAGVLILPAYIAWRQPAFIARYLSARPRATGAANAAD